MMLLSPSAAQAVFRDASPTEYDMLLQLLRRLSLKRGHFVLASGKTSNVYLDVRLTLLDPQGAYLAGRVLARGLRQLAPHMGAIGGMAVGAVPMVSTTLSAWAGLGYSQALCGFYVRQQAKRHGRQQQIEGHLQPHHRVVLLEDVATTGASTLQALGLLRQVYPQQQVSHVVALVDREAGAAEAFAQAGVMLAPVFSLSDVLGDAAPFAPLL
jgi:orotate phosphoribosyltransferase